MLLSSFFYYMLFGSAVLVYGIGIYNETVQLQSLKGLFLKIVRTLVCTLLTVTVSYFVNTKLLFRLNLLELFPVVAVLMYISISSFVEILFRLTGNNNTAEFSIAYIIILLALNEGTTLLDTIIITLGSLASFYLLLPILYVFLNRIKTTYPKNNKKIYGAILLCLAILLLLIASFNISWLNPGVIK